LPAGAGANLSHGNISAVLPVQEMAIDSTIVALVTCDFTVPTTGSSIAFYDSQLTNLKAQL